MPLQFLGRDVATDIFKPGERCQRDGGFCCENCRSAGKQTLVQVKSGDIFPMCATCADWDMGWRPAAASRP